jgi:hypothetical protein
MGYAAIVDSRRVPSRQGILSMSVKNALPPKADHRAKCMEYRYILFGISDALRGTYTMRFAQGTMVAPHPNPASINTQPIKFF